MPSDTAPRDALAQLSAAARHHVDGDLAAAEVAYRAFLEARPDDPVVLHLLGGLLFEKDGERLAAALDLQERSTTLDPNKHESQYTWACALAAAARAQESIAAFQRAIALNPNFVDAYLGLGVPMIEGGQIQQLIAIYDRALRERPDLALECTGRFRDFQDDAIRRRVPAILFLTMPKSGSIYIANRLVNGLVAPFCRISLSLFPLDHIVPSWLERFARGGAVCQEHLDASPRTIGLLKRAGLTRLVVHLRDPRQATLSWTHHIETLTGASAYLRKRIWPLLPEDYDRRSFAGKLDWNIAKHLRLLSLWAQAWVKLADAGAGELAIRFTSYEEFRRDEPGFYASLLEFYGIELADFDANPADLAKQEFHFRKGQTEEWREVFTQAQKQAAWRLMPDDLCARFGWRA